MHLLKYNFKKLIKEPSMIFWTLAFPIILSIFFNIAFGNLNQTVRNEYVILVDNVVINFVEDQDYIKYQEVNKDDAINLLKEKKGLLFIYSEEMEIKYLVLENGIEESLFINNIHNQIQKANINKDLSLNINYTVENTNYDVMTSYFYSLLGMLIMFSGFYGTVSISSIMPNLSKVGARTALAPTKKSKLILLDFITSYFFFLLIQIIFLLFLKYILKINMGDIGKISYLLLLVITGSLMGMAFGMLIGTISISENAKIGIINGVTLSLSAFAGLYSPDIKFIVDTKIPLLNKFNPLGIINDSMLNLVYFDNMKIFFNNILVLFIFFIIFIVSTILILRRQKYESI